MTDHSPQVSIDPLPASWRRHVISTYACTRCVCQELLTYTRARYFSCLVFQPNIKERTQGASSLSSLSKDPLGRLLSALPRQLPDAETTRNKGKQVGNAAKVGGARALAALKRSVRVITAARYFSETILAKGGSRRGEQQATGGGYMVSGVRALVSYFSHAAPDAPRKDSLSVDM